MFISKFICFFVILTIVLSATAKKCPKKCLTIKCSGPSEKDCLARNEIFKPADHDCFCCSACLKKLKEGDFCGPRAKNSECSTGLKCDLGSNKCTRIRKCPGRCMLIDCARPNPAHCQAKNGTMQPPDGDCNCCPTCKVNNGRDVISVLTVTESPKVPKNEGANCNPKAANAECNTGLNCDSGSNKCVRFKKCPGLCAHVLCARPDPNECKANNGSIEPSDGDCQCCPTCKLNNRTGVISNITIGQSPKVRKNEGDICNPTVDDAECATGLICNVTSRRCTRNRDCAHVCRLVRCARPDPIKCLANNGTMQWPDGNCKCCPFCKLSPHVINHSELPKVKKNEGDNCNSTAANAECATGLNCDRGSNKCVRIKRYPGLCERVRCARPDPNKCLGGNGIFQPPDGDCNCCGDCKTVSRPDPTLTVIDFVPQKIPKLEGHICDPTLANNECASGLNCDRESKRCARIKKCPGLCARVFCARLEQSKCIGGAYLPPDGDCNCCGSCKEISRPNPILNVKNLKSPKQRKILANCPKNVCTQVKCGVREGTCNTPDKFILPRGGICGCCSACVKKLNKGDPCKISVGDVKPDAVCFTGLTCDNTKRICV